MADHNGPTKNENANRNPNQNPNQVQDNVQNDDPGENPPPYNPFLPNAPIVPGVPQRPKLKWSHFKWEYAGKQEEDAEAHLLRTNDWMDTYDFQDHVKVQRFCFNFSRGS